MSTETKVSKLVEALTEPAPGAKKEFLVTWDEVFVGPTESLPKPCLIAPLIRGIPALVLFKGQEVFLMMKGADTRKFKHKLVLGVDTKTRLLAGTWTLRVADEGDIPELTCIFHDCLQYGTDLITVQLTRLLRLSDQFEVPRGFNRQQIASESHGALFVKFQSARIFEGHLLAALWNKPNRRLRKFVVGGTLVIGGGPSPSYFAYPTDPYAAEAYLGDETLIVTAPPPL